MDKRKSFFEIIFTHYIKIVKDRIPQKLLEEMCVLLTNYYFDEYAKFRIKYPKSIKRYSSFQVKDLDHPYTKEIIIKFFKNKLGDRYSDFTRIVLNMTEAELIKFEKNRLDFDNMF